jgi:hypothetical protein
MKKVSVFLSIVLLMTLCFEAAAGPISTPFLSVSTCTDSLALIEFTGTYKFKENNIVPSVTVRIQKGALEAVTPEGTAYTFKALAGEADNFIIEALESEVVFLRDADKKVKGMTVKMPDVTLAAEKEMDKK